MSQSLALTRGLSSGLSKAIARPEGVGVAGPYPAPDGYHWEYVAEDGVINAEDGVPEVELMRNAA